jgi:hypothetical protein
MPPAVATANTCMNSRRLKLINIPFQLITDICAKKKRLPFLTNSRKAQPKWAWAI